PSGARISGVDRLLAARAVTLEARLVARSPRGVLGAEQAQRSLLRLRGAHRVVVLEVRERERVEDRRVAFAAALRRAAREVERLGHVAQILRLAGQQVPR